MRTRYDVEALRSALGERLFFHEELDSTNDEALRMAREGAEAYSVVVAERQTAGRGRRGADWFCGEGAGLAFSFILRPEVERVLWPRLSLVAGLAVAQSIESLGLFPEIKWPNDVLLAGRKVCGILVEAEPDCVVVGVGLNVGSAQLPFELKEVATSLQEQGGVSKTREEHLLAIVEHTQSWQGRIDRDFADVMAQVRSRCALSGKEISFLVGQEQKQGHCEGLGEGGDLLVREGGEVQRYLAADQIRVLV